MKNYKFFLFFASLLLVSTSYSTTWIVTAGGTSFTPSSVTVNVGDTVKWQWIDGSHTTTSTTIPSGAASWNQPLDVVNPEYKYVITLPGTYNYVCIPHQAFGMVGVIHANPIGIIPLGTNVPDAYSLGQNYPNPFNPSTNIKFDLPKNSAVKIVVFDITGKQSAVLFDGELNAGSYSVDWDASAFPSSVYFYRLSTNDFTQTKRMVLVK